MEKNTSEKTFLGVEFGSTRIKAVLIDSHHMPLAQGAWDWESRLEDGVWTYHLDEVWRGLSGSVSALVNDYRECHTSPFPHVSALGISAMMHGYLAFDKNGRQLVPFRTWRNTTTGEAAAALTETFGFNIPQRWSVAHLYQAILNNEKHVRDIDFITTLAGYVHWKLTGVKALGVGDASGMFPIDSASLSYNERMLEKFNVLAAQKGLSRKIETLLPRVLAAGENAGTLTSEGAKLLDPQGVFTPGIPLCPPEGDAGTGMTATNSVAPRSGNVSAGTSIFAMVVLEKPLSRVYPEIDMVTTPTGKPVAMVHCNSCSSDIDAWVKLLGEAIALSGGKIEKAALYDALYNKALEGDADCGGLVSYNYYGGEPVAGLENGRPLFTRFPESSLSLANFMRVHLFSTMAALRLGMNILTGKEGVSLDVLTGHGGLFKTRGVAQRFMASALGVPVAVMAGAGEGGAWGIALLAAYFARRESSAETLEAYLVDKVFSHDTGNRVNPDARDARGFEIFMERYTAGLAIEKTAVKALHACGVNEEDIV